MASVKRTAEAPPDVGAGGGGPAAAPPAVDTVEITPLGAGSEVGRSCILVSYKGKNVLLDCGIHPGLSGMASLPYFDDVDLATVRARAARAAVGLEPPRVHAPRGCFDPCRTKLRANTRRRGHALLRALA